MFPEKFMRFNFETNLSPVVIVIGLSLLHVFTNPVVRHDFGGPLKHLLKHLTCGYDPHSQSGRHLDGYGGLCLDERQGGRCAEKNKSGYPSGRQPSCHEWEDLEYGVLA